MTSVIITTSHTVGNQNKGPNAVEVDVENLELRIASVRLWLDNLQDCLTRDANFGLIVVILHDGLHNLGPLGALEANFWQKMQARSRKLVTSNDRLLCGMADIVGGQRLCILSNLKDDVLADAHDTVAGWGHNGVECTVASINTRFH
jgi:hypothetical protein